ncbi:hypothetical protein EJB05_31563 [Eragrostis curvula]|uniref:Uncharacterized protein n=1 Tax=Eragrostis curvula TaxID=38414 RepID=A0A5J9UDZ0_9POAL|nr:hypothetical protein EJB05_31563 [Eragrostis curvula]
MPFSFSGFLAEFLPTNVCRKNCWSLAKTKKLKAEYTKKLDSWNKQFERVLSIASGSRVVSQVTPMKVQHHLLKEH